MLLPLNKYWEIPEQLFILCWSNIGKFLETNSNIFLSIIHLFHLAMSRNPDAMAAGEQILIKRKHDESTKNSCLPCCHQELIAEGWKTLRSWFGIKSCAFVCSFGLITQASRACLAIPQIGRGPVSRPLTLAPSTTLSYQHQDMQSDEISLMLFSKNHNFPARLSTSQILSGIPLKLFPDRTQGFHLHCTKVTSIKRVKQPIAGLLFSKNYKFQISIKYCLLYFAEKLKKFTNKRRFFYAEKHTPDTRHQMDIGGRKEP